MKDLNFGFLAFSTANILKMASVKPCVPNCRVVRPSLQFLVEANKIT